jgi:hypothetical protein
MTPEFEFISVTLEIFAFFFITTELYGEANFRAATDKLECIARAAKRVSTSPMRSFAGVEEGDASFSMWRAGLILVPPILLIYYFLFFVAYSYLVERLTLTGLLILTMPALFFGGVALLIFGAYALATFASWLLSRGFKGALLFLGTCLFLTAKGMIWAHLGRELEITKYFFD